MLTTTGFEAVGTVPAGSEAKVPPAFTVPPPPPDGATGVTGPDAAEAALVPIALVAVTVNVYAVPFVKPATVELTPDVVKPVHAEQAGDGVTEYPVIADPPSLAGAVHDTTAWPSPGAAFTLVGAPGAVANGTWKLKSTRLQLLFVAPAGTCMTRSVEVAESKPMPPAPSPWQKLDPPVGEAGPLTTHEVAWGASEYS
jgi:hypothetical protein